MLNASITDTNAREESNESLQSAIEKLLLSEKDTDYIPEEALEF